MKTTLIKRFITSFLVLGLSFVLAGCQSAVGSASNDSGASQSASQKAGGQQGGGVETESTTTEVIPQQPIDTGEVYTDSVPSSSSADGNVLDENGRIMGRMVNGEFIADPNYVPGPSASGDLLSQTIIYFDFDQSSVRPEFVAVLAAHAANLAANPGLSLRLEGHADERGSREYNIGLGERRAQAVKRAMMLNGVSTGSLNTVSFGEEKPMVQGTGESSWSQNRRVELVYR